MSAAEADGIAAEYQAKLLNYRFRNFAKVRTPAFDLNPFTPSMRDIAYSLGACVVDDDDLQARLVPLLKPADQELRVNHTSLLTAITLEVLLARCHSNSGHHVTVAEVTEGVNTVLSGRGETLVLSPEKVGWLLRGLGVHTQFVVGGRKGLMLSGEVREKIHELAAGYGVRTLRDLPAKIECPLCAKLALPWQVETASECAS